MLWRTKHALNPSPLSLAHSLVPSLSLSHTLSRRSPQALENTTAYPSLCGDYYVVCIDGEEEEITTDKLWSGRATAQDFRTNSKQ